MALFYAPFLLIIAEKGFIYALIWTEFLPRAIFATFFRGRYRPKVCYVMAPIVTYCHSLSLKRPQKLTNNWHRSKVEMSFKKVCKVCGRTFHSAKYSSRFCSENCYVKAKNWAQETRYLLDKEGDMRTLNQILYHKECLYCGTPFTAKNTRAVYCSPRCGKLHRKAKIGRASCRERVLDLV